MFSPVSQAFCEIASIHNLEVFILAVDEKMYYLLIVSFTSLFALLTKTWSKYVNDSFRSMRQKDGPIEAENDNYEQGWHDNFVHRLYCSHTSTNGQTSCQYGNSMAQDRPMIDCLKVQDYKSELFLLSLAL